MSFPDDLLHLVRTDEPLGPLVWLGIGGPARYFAEPVDDSEIQRLVEVGEDARSSGSNSGWRQQRAGPRVRR